LRPVSTGLKAVQTLIQSLFDGGSLHGGSLKEDAKLAMEHLIEKFTNGFD
jgi:hypothetical protein